MAFLVQILFWNFQNPFSAILRQTKTKTKKVSKFDWGGGGGKALVAGPLKKISFFAASLSI